MSDSSDSESDDGSVRRRKFVDDGEAALRCKKHFCASTMETEIVRHVRNDIFPFSKFPPCNEQCETTILAIKNQLHIELPDGVSDEFFASYWTSTLKKNVTLCRHNAQTLARKNFLGKFSTLAMRRS